MGMPSGLGLHSGHAPPLGFSEWVCEPIFQTLLYNITYFLFILFIIYNTIHNVFLFILFI